MHGIGERERASEKARVIRLERERVRRWTGEKERGRDLAGEGARERERGRSEGRKRAQGEEGRKDRGEEGKKRDRERQQKRGGQRCRFVCVGGGGWRESEREGAQRDLEDSCTCTTNTTHGRPVVSARTAVVE